MERNCGIMNMQRNSPCFTTILQSCPTVISWPLHGRRKTADEAKEAGRKPHLIPNAGLWPDKIIEIAPTDKSHGNIVWEWHYWDHLVQDADPSKKNYGVVADHPELLDINALDDTLPARISEDSMEILKAKGEILWRNQTPDNMGSDIFHTNAIKYNADLDQIVFSSPHLNEIYIIDHSTTTKEAAGHKGGRWGKGGDFLYRWGNAKNYKRGDTTTQQLFGQHDVRWIDKGTPGEGHLTIYNNDIHQPNGLNYSAIYEIVPPTDAKGNYTYGKREALRTCQTGVDLHCARYRLFLEQFYFRRRTAKKRQHLCQ